MPTLLQVALGGAIGASLRWLMVSVAVRDLAVAGFPAAIVVVNILGSFLVGFIAVFADAKGMMQIAPFVMIGILGGFTTFSTFSMETFVLIEKGLIAQAALYVLVSVIGAIAALVAGVYLARAVLT